MRQRVFKIFVPVILLMFFSCEKGENEETIRVEDRIFDEAKLLTEEQQQKLFDLIIELQENVGSQIAIFTMNSLNGETIENFSLKKVNELKLGRQKEKDGLLVVVALHEREMRIEVGFGLERIVEDQIALRNIREDMAPKFKTGDFYEGLFAGVNKIKGLIENNKDLIGELHKRY